MGSTRRFLAGYADDNDLSPYESCVFSATHWPTPSAVGLDGGCYTKRFTDDEVMLARIDPDDSRTLYTRTTLGLEPQLGVDFPRVGPDGTIWAPLYGPRGIFEGLLAYDGSSWSIIPYEGDDAGAGGADTSLDLDGVVWVSRLVADAAPVLSWDGRSWGSYLRHRGDDTWLLPVQPWPNGVVWFGSDARWDGANVSLVESAIPWGKARLPAYAPDGSAWTVVDGHLYVITPEAVDQ